MDNELKFLRDLYLEDLRKEVVYQGQRRSRVYHPAMWESVETTLREGVEESLQLPPTDVTRNVWLWSDLHFGHKNIIDFSNRPYPNLDLMHECLELNFRDYVGPNDVSIWVGDIAFMPDSMTNEILDRCPGYKILIVGNHDFNKKKVRKLNFDDAVEFLHANQEQLEKVFNL